jgi:hypothetical protein
MMRYTGCLSGNYHPAYNLGTFTNETKYNAKPKPKNHLQSPNRAFSNAYPARRRIPLNQLYTLKNKGYEN